MVEFHVLIIDRNGHFFPLGSLELSFRSLRGLYNIVGGRKTMDPRNEHHIWIGN